MCFNSIAMNSVRSNILQTLIVRIADKKHLEQVETFARILAGVGENGVLCLIEDMSGSNLIIKYLEKFSAKHNQVLPVSTYSRDSSFNPSMIYLVQ